MIEKIKKIIPRKIFKTLQPAYHFIFSFLAALVYGFPSDRLVVIGVTGTTGKTSTVYLLARALKSMGFKVGYTSTAMFSDGEKEWLNDKKMTMVGRFFNQKLIRRMFKNGCQFAIIESTSEGMRQFRHRFINFDTLLITGIYPEHIESHGSFENYRAAKGLLFSHLKRCRTKYIDAFKKVSYPSSELKKLELDRVKKTIIVNGDDVEAPYFSSFWAEKKIAFLAGELGQKKLENFSETVLQDLEMVCFNQVVADENGTAFQISLPVRYRDQAEIENLTSDTVPVSLKLLGGFNAQNAAAALTVCASLSLDLNRAKIGLEEVSGLAGKLERIDQGQPFLAIVDYAFEPHALEKLYETIGLIPHYRVIQVLGSCGGGRDEARRPVIGRLAGEKADIVIVTNEDPYDDDPNIIIDQVSLGAEATGKKIGEDLFKILDRRQAIRYALGLARPGDLVLLTGKGAEQYICVKNGEKIPWDDRVVLREELENLKSN